MTRKIEAIADAMWGVVLFIIVLFVLLFAVAAPIVLILRMFGVISV